MKRKLGRVVVCMALLIGLTAAKCEGGSKHPHHPYGRKTEAPK